MACLPPPSGPGSALRRQFVQLTVDSPLAEAPVQLPDPDAYHLAALGSGSQELGLFWRAGRVGLRDGNEGAHATPTPAQHAGLHHAAGAACWLLLCAGGEGARRPGAGGG